MSNLGGTTLRGHFFLKKTGAFSKKERALLCSLQNLGGHVPPVPPAPMSMKIMTNESYNKQITETIRVQGVSKNCSTFD